MGQRQPNARVLMPLQWAADWCVTRFAHKGMRPFAVRQPSQQARLTTCTAVFGLESAQLESEVGARSEPRAEVRSMKDVTSLSQ